MLLKSMSSTVLFVLMVIISIILLLVTSLTSTVAASEAFASSFYNTDPLTRSAHQYLTIAAALGWVSLVVLIIVFIVAFITGEFSTIAISEALLLNPNPTVGDIDSAKLVADQLASGRITQLIILVMTVVIAITAFIIGILAAIGAAALGEMSQQDESSRAAYTSGIISAISGLLAGVFLFIVTLSYSRVRSARDQELGKIQLFQAQNVNRVVVATS
ncbi:MAG: hypothetical protein ABIQ41_13025 [Gemmatimonadales bacterium]